MSASTPTRLPAPDLEDAGVRDPVKIVYVMGAAHSGSTLRGVALGNRAGFFHADVVASELRGIHRQDVAERRLRTLTTNVSLWLTNLVSRLVFQSHARERRLFVRYEDFCPIPRRAAGDALARRLARRHPGPRLAAHRHSARRQQTY